MYMIRVSLNKYICCNAWSDAVRWLIVLLPSSAMVMYVGYFERGSAYWGTEYVNIRESVHWG